jgi:hypothetical protein
MAEEKNIAINLQQAEDSLECRYDISGWLIKIEPFCVKLSTPRSKKTVRNDGVTSHSFDRA